MPGRRSVWGSVAVCVTVGIVAGAGLRLLPSSPSGRLVDPELARGVPTLLSPSELARLARSDERRLFWLGRLEGRALEVTDGGAQGLFVRYVPVRPGNEPRSPSTTVATYPVKRAYPIAVRSGRARDAVTERLGSGAVAVWRRSRPTNVYVAFRGAEVLVEVFDPQPARALDLARSGRLAPAG